MAVEQLHAAVLQRSASVVQQCLQAAASALNRCARCPRCRRRPPSRSADTESAVATLFFDGWFTTKHSYRPREHMGLTARRVDVCAVRMPARRRHSMLRCGAPPASPNNCGTPIQTL